MAGVVALADSAEPQKKPKKRPRGKPFAKGAPTANPRGRPRAEQERGYLDAARRAVPVATWQKAVARCLEAAVAEGDAKALLALARLLPGALAPERVESTSTVVSSTLEPGPLTPEVASAAAAYAEALAAARRPAPPSA